MVEDLSLFFTDFAETVTVNAVQVQAIFDDGAGVVLGEVIAGAPALLLPASSAPAAAEGQTCVVRTIAYRIRQVLPQAPDAALVLLVLAKG